MAEAANQVSDYFLRYGLQQDPFAAAADEGFYFETPALSQRLDLMLHLIEFSHETAMILGEKGIGKTAMLNRIRTRAPAHWRVCRVAADPMRDAVGLLSAIAEGFGLPLNSGANMAHATDALQAHLRASEQSMLIPVVLVDDAHELPVDALALLMELAQPEEDRVRLRLVLFCEPQITSMLVNPKLRRFKQGIMHTLDIPALSDEQAQEYLGARLDYAGLEGESPFNAGLVSRLNRTAEGRPGRLNALARQALIGGELPTEKKPPHTRSPARASRLQRRHVVVAGVLLAGSVVLALLIREPEHPARETAQPEVVPLELPTEKAPVVKTLPASPPPTPAAEAKEETPPAAASASPAEAPPAEEAQAPPPEPTPTKPAAAPAEPAPEPASEKSALQHQAPPPAEAAQAPPPAPAPAKPVAETPKPAPKPVAERPAPEQKQPPPPPQKPAESADAAWLRSQPREHYVLQLYASTDMASVKKFLHDYHLGDKARTVATRHSGKRWYVVLYGSYRDRAAAARASATLPPRIQQLKPWPRSIAAVDNVLEKKP